MKHFVIAYISVLLVGMSCTSAVADESIAQAAVSLNNQAKASFGVSVRALQFLFDGGPGAFLLKDALVQNGSWPSLQALESSGYIEKTLMETADGDFVQITLTVKGKALRDALAEP